MVVSRQGNVVGEGAHRRPGTPHAETYALEMAGPEARGGTIYVTLEPCSFSGRTPPCVEAIIAAGVSHVVVAVEDPDSRVAGTGMRALRDAGLTVEVGMLGAEVEEIDPAYFHHRRTGLPRVTYKAALTLDGSVAALDGSSQWISGESARRDVHQLRGSVDAVVIGSGTANSDDPLLNARYDHQGPQPRPVIVTGESKLSPQLRIWEMNPLVVATRAEEHPGGEMLVVDGPEGRPDPTATASALADEGYLDLLLEGGPALAGSWWRAGLISRGVFYLGAKVGGGRGINPIAGEFMSLDDARAITIESVERLGPDLKVVFS